MSEVIIPGWTRMLLHVCVILVFSIGLLCFFLRKQLIRQIVGLKLMLQSVSLGIISAGWENGNMNLAQSMIISALVIEAVVMGMALTMIVHMSKHEQKEQLIMIEGISLRNDDG